MSSVDGPTRVEFEARSPQASRDALSRCLALGCVGLVVTHSQWQHLAWAFDIGTVTLIGLVAVIVVRNGQVEGLGLQSVPLQGWWYWCCWSGWLAIGIGLVLAIYALVVWCGGLVVRSPRTDPQHLLAQGLFMIVYAPVVEEIVFRSLLCFSVAPTLGSRSRILLSGTLFAAMHWIYGNPSPENQLGGFFLAYAFVRSNTIAVPIALHASGNALALASQVLNWYVVRN